MKQEGFLADGLVCSTPFSSSRDAVMQEIKGRSDERSDRRLRRRQRRHEGMRSLPESRLRVGLQEGCPGLLDTRLHTYTRKGFHNYVLNTKCNRNDSAKQLMLYDTEFTAYMRRITIQLK